MPYTRKLWSHTMYPNFLLYRMSQKSYSRTTELFYRTFGIDNLLLLYRTSQKNKIEKYFFSRTCDRKRTVRPV